MIKQLNNYIVLIKTIFLQKIKIPLRGMIFLSLIIPTSITVLFIAWASLQKEQIAVKQLAIQLNSQTGSSLTHDLDNYLEVPSLIHKINQDLIKLGWLDSNDLIKIKDLFFQQIKQFNVGQINFGSTKGEFVGVKRKNDNSLVTNLMTKSSSENLTDISKDNEYNYQTESWYRDVVKTGKPVWNKVYNSEYSSESQAILASYPVYDQNNSLIGVLAVELPVSEIDKLLQTANITQSNVIYLIEKSGIVVASNSNQSLDNSSKILIQEIANKLLETKEDYYDVKNTKYLELKVTGEQYFVKLIPSQNQNNLDWLIVVAVSKSDLATQINTNFKRTLFLYLLAMTLVIYLGILISHWITKPIYKLLKAAQNNLINEEDLSSVSKIVLFKEIEDLVQSFNQVNERLKKKSREGGRFFDISLDLLVIVGTDGYFKKLNSSWSRILGYTTEELLTVPYIEFVHPEDKDTTLAEIQKITDGAKAIKFQNRYRTKDGSYCWLAWNSVPFLTENLIYAVVRDITDEKETLESFLHSQAQLIEAEKIAGIGSWENDLATSRLICSEEVYKIFSIQQKSTFVTIEDYLKLVHYDDLSTIQKAIDLAINQGQSYQLDQRILCPDGELKYISITGKPSFDEEGKVIKLFGTILNITERKQIEAALQESQDIFNKLAENINSVFWVHDPQNNQIFYISPSYEKIWGYRRDELYKSPHSFLDAIYPEDRPKVVEALANFTEVEERQEYRIILPNGEIRWILTRALPIKNQAGKVDKIARIAQDISEDKLVDAKLQLIQERLQLVLETSGDGLWDWNISTGECYYSYRWLEMLGYDPDDLPKKIDSWEMLIHPQDKVWVMDALNLHLEDSSFIYAFDYRLQTKSGEWKWIAVYGKVVVRDEIGKPLRMIGSHKDISDRKAAEVTLKQQLELEKLVANISTSFINLNPNEINSSIQIALKQLCELIGADRSYMFLVSNGRVQVSKTHQWRATKTEAEIENQQNIPIDSLPWIMEKLNQLEVIHIPLVSNLPLEASMEKRILSAQSIQSLLCIPMVSGDELIGLVGFDAVSKLCSWTKSTINLLKIIGKIFVSALEHQEAELALRESEKRFRMMADSAPVFIWMSGSNSLFNYFNQRWLDFTGRNLEQEVGKGWLEGIHPEDVQHYLENYRVNFYTHQSFTIEYRLRREDGEYRWILNQGVPRFNLNGKFAGYIGSCIDISDRKTAEEQIQNSLQEKEILLKEIHHRVKNNLHIISNLLDLQSDYIENQKVQELFADSQNRIQSMALIHEQLYQSKNLGEVDFSEYIHALIDNLFCSYADRGSLIQPIINVEAITLNLETAIPCGLLINELVTNSFKHGFPNSKSGEICIELHQDQQEKVYITIKDNGIGIPPDFDWQNSSSLGLKLVQILSKQLKAEINFDSNKGTIVNLIFSPLKYKSRF
ncbi:MAG: PAS domain-containing protein [Okeania sp. SIO2C9]|uniref:PAS domain-containing protein n=1 Tax=Okeania sp. SIO2C9 TaxID=2607791 RepID=UPI0013C01EC8|nr:PAS domain-containing protein [Okeania sp. SIO2C9]NEQ76645.1 PAS domain-containing protein [Okeania sp. SIO2C9]